MTKYKSKMRQLHAFILSFIMLITLFSNVMGNTLMVQAAMVSGNINLGSATIKNQADLTYQFLNPTIQFAQGTDGNKLTVFAINVDSGYFTIDTVKNTINGEERNTKELDGIRGLNYQAVYVWGDNLQNKGYTSSSGKVNTDANFEKPGKFASITITGSFSDEAITKYLKRFTFYQQSESQPQKVNAAISDIDLSDKAVSMGDDGSLHFYEYIAYDSTNTDPDTGNTWQNAYAAAKKRTFHGMKGYLMTITSEAEQSFIHNQLGTDEGWIGGTRYVYTTGLVTEVSRAGADADTYMLTDEIKSVTGSKKPASVDTFNKLQAYFWVCGPEAGQPFWYGNCVRGGEYNKIKDTVYTPYSSDSYTPTGKTYAQLNESTYHKWHSTEPNRYSEAEGFVTYAYRKNNNGAWNDWGNIDTEKYNADTDKSIGAMGYYVEYSNYPGGMINEQGETVSYSTPIIQDTKIIDIKQAPQLNIKAINTSTRQPMDISPEFQPKDGKTAGEPYEVYMPVDQDSDKIDMQIVPNIVDPNATITIKDSKGNTYTVSGDMCNNIPVNIGHNLFEIISATVDDSGNAHSKSYNIDVIRKDVNNTPVVSIKPNDPNDKDNDSKITVSNSSGKAYDNEPDYGKDTVVHKIITVPFDTYELNLNPSVTNAASIEVKVVSGSATAGYTGAGDVLNVKNLKVTPDDTVIEMTITDTSAAAYKHHYIYTIIRQKGSSDTPMIDLANRGEYGVDPDLTVETNGESVNMSDYLPESVKKNAKEIIYHCCSHTVLAIDKDGTARALKRYLKSDQSLVHIIVKDQNDNYEDYTVLFKVNSATKEEEYGKLVKSGGINYEITGTNTCRVSSWKTNAAIKKKKVTIPATIKVGGKKYTVNEVAPAAFLNNSKIEELTIGKNVKTVGSTSFVGMSKLKKFKVAKGNKYFKPAGKKGNSAKMLLTKNKKTLVAMSNVTGTVTLPKSVTRVNEYAGAANYKMKALVIPKNVKRIDPCAFAHATKMKKVTFKGKLPEMANNCILDRMNKKGTVTVPKKQYNAYYSAFESASKKRYGIVQFPKMKQLKKSKK